MFRTDLLTDPGGMSLADWLHRLRESLEDLLVRLTEGLAVTVSEAAADAIRDAVLALLGRVAPSRSRQAWPRTPASFPPRWQDDEEEGYPWFRAQANDGWSEEPDPIEPEPPVTQQPNQTPTRWSGALSAGCQNAAWWLRRCSGPRALLVAAGVGVASAVAALLIGPLAVTVAGSAFTLLGLATATRSAATVLGRAGAT
jgi:hypothetical protein